MKNLWPLTGLVVILMMATVWFLWSRPEMPEAIENQPEGPVVQTIEEKEESESVKPRPAQAEVVAISGEVVAGFNMTRFHRVEEE